MYQACWHLIHRNIQGIANARNQEFFLMLAYLEHLNKVCDLANLIEASFSRGYAKTVVLSCFQRGDRACGASTKLK